MAFERPTLPELIEQSAADLESRLPGVLARVRRSLAGVLVRVLAGGLSALYQYLEWLIGQAWPDQAEAEYLDGHGTRWGVTRNMAVAATGTLLVSGNEGATLPAATVYQRADGTRFTVDVGVTLSAGGAQVQITAETVGQDGNTDIDTQFTLVSPAAGINSVAVAATAISGGADDELDEAYRARILTRIRQAPHGGASADYVAWALEVSGVTRAWMQANGMGAGTVVVRFVRDDDSNPIPDAGEVQRVQNYLDSVRPVTADVYVLAPVATPVAYTISGLSPDTPQVRAAITAELQDLHVREAEPGVTLLITHIREAISIAADEHDHVLVSPSANVTCQSHQLLTFGGVTWQA